MKVLKTIQDIFHYTYPFSGHLILNSLFTLKPNLNSLLKKLPFSPDTRYASFNALDEVKNI
jgi:hypothetical protein